MILSICPNCKQKRRIVTSTSSEGSSLFLVSLLILHLFSTSFTSKHPKPPQNRAPHNLQPAEPKLGPAHGLCVVLRVPGADGWWLRLASGKKWVPETWNGREAQNEPRARRCSYPVFFFEVLLGVGGMRESV